MTYYCTLRTVRNENGTYDVIDDRGYKVANLTEVRIIAPFDHAVKVQIEIFDANKDGVKYAADPRDSNKTSKIPSITPCAPSHDALELLKRALLASNAGIRKSVEVFSNMPGEISISRRNVFSLKEYKNPNVKTIKFEAGDTTDILLKRYFDAK